MNEDLLNRLTALLQQRLQSGDPASSYVAKLYHKGENAFLKKIAEESGEVIMACKDGQREDIVYESADLLFHLLVALTYHHITIDEVLQELARREGLSGLQEKAQRQND